MSPSRSSAAICEANTLRVLARCVLSSDTGRKVSPGADGRDSFKGYRSASRDSDLASLDETECEKLLVRRKVDDGREGSPRSRLDLEVEVRVVHRNLSSSPRRSRSKLLGRNVSLMRGSQVQVQRSRSGLSFSARCPPAPSPVAPPRGCIRRRFAAGPRDSDATGAGPRR